MEENLVRGQQQIILRAKESKEKKRERGREEKGKRVVCGPWPQQAFFP